MSPTRPVLRILAGACVALGVMAMAPLASSQDERRVEVVKVEGIVDAAMEDAIVETIAVAEEVDAEAVVVQLDSAGALGTGRTRRLVRAILGADVPVITWVGPPGAQARHSSAVLALAGDVAAIAPGARLGPVETLDLRSDGPRPGSALGLLGDVADARDLSSDAVRDLTVDPAFADTAETTGLVDLLALQLPDLLDRVDGESVEVRGRDVRLSTDPDTLSVRFHKASILGRALHATGKASIAYLLLILGLIGLVFEVFHPSNGPAGGSGAVSLALAGYGLWTLGASPLAVGLIVAAVVAFSIDLRVEGLGLFSLLGLVGLVWGSLELFEGPYIRISPWVLGIGIVGMTLFMITVMTRVLGDLRAIARGELEVSDPHPH